MLLIFSEVYEFGKAITAFCGNLLDFFGEATKVKLLLVREKYGAIF
jgi:hypothetical protein